MKALHEEDGMLISCPWCHADMKGKFSQAQIMHLVDCGDVYRGAAQATLRARDEEIERLRSLINTPHIEEFLEAVRFEAAHQCERWGAEHDVGKADTDWYWLIGYLAGKALNKPEKKLHHIITTAAACLNWHAQSTGARNAMRPGIDSAILDGPCGTR